MNILKNFLLFAIFLFGIIWLFNFLKLHQLQERYEKALQEHERLLEIDSLNQCTIDSLQIHLDFLRQTIDSLPIGAPLDTILIQDDFGTRKHPIFGNYQMHSGLDMIDTYHDTIYSTASGIVEQSCRNFGYGNCIQIKHAYGFKTKYGHLYKMFVKKGDNIIKGQPIGLMGATGDVTGQHLHYEILHNSNPIDPEPFVRVNATMYHPVEAQCDDNPLITADGSLIDPYNVSDWNWIAVSQDMLVRNGGILNYGDSVLIKGTEHKDGIYYIHDCMNKRAKYKIDFLENIGTPQYRYNNIELYVLGN